MEIIDNIICFSDSHIMSTYLLHYNTFGLHISKNKKDDRMVNIINFSIHIVFNDLKRNLFIS